MQNRTVLYVLFSVIHYLCRAGQLAFNYVPTHAWLQLGPTGECEHVAIVAASQARSTRSIRSL